MIMLAEPQFNRANVTLSYHEVQQLLWGMSHDPAAIRARNNVAERAVKARREYVANTLGCRIGRRVAIKFTNGDYREGVLRVDELRRGNEVVDVGTRWALQLDGATCEGCGRPDPNAVAVVMYGFFSEAVAEICTLDSAYARVVL